MPSFLRGPKTYIVINSNKENCYQMKRRKIMISPSVCHQCCHHVIVVVVVVDEVVVVIIVDVCIKSKSQSQISKVNLLNLK